MGLFDTYGNVQLKVGDLNMSDYQIGDETPIPNGIYFAPEGAVVIYRGVFVAEIAPGAVFDKWGGIIEIDVDLRNPVSEAIVKYNTPAEKAAPEIAAERDRLRGAMIEAVTILGNDYCEDSRMDHAAKTLQAALAKHESDDKEKP